MAHDILKHPARTPHWNVHNRDALPMAVGTTAVVLLLVLIRALLPDYVMPAIATIAFIGMGGVGFMFLRAGPADKSRRDLLLALMAVLAMVWIVAGRLSFPEF